MTLPRWTPAEMDARRRSRRIVLVQLHASWCPQCTPQEKAVLPVVAEYVDSVEVGSVDVGQHAELLDRYEIRTLASRPF